MCVAITMARAFGFEAVRAPRRATSPTPPPRTRRRPGCPATCSCPTTWSARRSSPPRRTAPRSWRSTGNYDDVNRLCSEVAESLPWAFVNVNMRPFYAEGSKSLGFETAEQLGWRLPDHWWCRSRPGRSCTKIHRAFSELIAIGAVEEQALPRLRRAGGGLPPGGAGVRSDGADEVTPGEAGHDRPLARDRDAGRRLSTRSRSRAQTGGAIDVRAPKTRSSTGSSCWPRPRACSRRPRAASRSRPQAPGRARRDPARRGDRRLRHRQRLQDDRGAGGQDRAELPRRSPTSTSSSRRSTVIAAEAPSGAPPRKVVRTRPTVAVRCRSDADCLDRAADIMYVA